MAIISQGAVKILSYQRPTYRRMSEAEASVAFTKELEHFCHEFKQFFPRPSMQKRSFLDIGCGMGFGLLALNKLYGPNNTFVGLDRGVVDEDIFYGFEEKASAYNSFELTRTTLIQNGVPESAIRLVDIDKEGFPSSFTFDVVTSHIAWGFHFPVATYLDNVLEVTRKGSLLLLDLRRNTDGVRVLSNHFHLKAAFPRQKSLTSVWERA